MDSYKVDDYYGNPKDHLDEHEDPPKSFAETVLDSFLKLGNVGVSLASGLLAAALVLYSGYVIGDQFSIQQSAKSSWDLLQYKPEFFNEAETPLAGGSLASINNDYRAWLTVFDTSIDYPVMQGKDDLEYASKDIYGNTGVLTGSIYLAAANSPDFSDSYNIVYGHHMDVDAMFGGLDYYTPEKYDGDAAKSLSYFNSHRDALIITDQGAKYAYDVEIFAVIKTSAYDGNIYNPGDSYRSVVNYLNGLTAEPNEHGARMIHYDPSSLAKGNQIVALSTCDGASTLGRLVVFGVMTPRTTYATVEKQWQDDDNRDGKRPASLTVTLYNQDDVEMGSVTLSSANNWKATLENLPLPYDGDLTVYTWKEPEIEGYEIVGNAVDTEDEHLTRLINRHEIETASITVTKIWNDEDDRDGLRPESVTLSLLANGEQVNSAALTGEGNTWTYTFTEMPVYEDGQRIAYTVDEVPGANYDAVISGLTVTNTYVPETVSRTVVKAWNDNGDLANMRPESLRVTLTGGGESRTVTLNAGNGWTATVDGLRKYSEGQEIEYTWTEDEVLGYSMTGYDTIGDVTTITNTYRTRPVLPPDQAPDPSTVPGAPLYQIDDYDTPLGIMVEINHVGDTFD